MCNFVSILQTALLMASAKNHPILHGLHHTPCRQCRCRGCDKFSVYRRNWCSYSNYKSISSQSFPHDLDGEVGISPIHKQSEFQQKPTPVVRTQHPCLRFWQRVSFIVTNECFWCTALGDCQKCMWGYTETLFNVQLVAERSPSKQRALGVAITSARRVNVEGSAFGLRQVEGSVKSKKWFSSIKREDCSLLYNHSILHFCPSTCFSSSLIHVVRRRWGWCVLISRIPTLCYSWMIYWNALWGFFLTFAPKTKYY